ncbi:MAG: NAD(P)-dependent oxidoreductase [Candidatus Aminicenantes bacterium]|jgi:nucleoside-diphosphate-sugar epimerase
MTPSLQRLILISSIGKGSHVYSSCADRLTQFNEFPTICAVKAFVTGGTGFIGSHLIEYLLNQKNADVYALVRNRNRLKWLEGLDIHILEGDLFSIPPLPGDIEFVFHIAGVTKANQPAKYYTVNQQGTASLLRALEAQCPCLKRFILLSSQAATGPSHSGQPVKENQLPSPISDYGRSKLQSEYEALDYKNLFPVVIFRASTIFGPRDPVLLPYFRIIKRGILPSLGSKPRYVSLCYVKDLIKAFDLSTKKPVQSGDIFHIAHSIPYRWDDIGLAAGRAMNKNLRTIKLPLCTLYPYYLVAEILGKIQNNPSLLSREKYCEMKQKGWIADTEAVGERLDFSPQFSLQHAIQETIDWYREKGWL